jgi:hypothetical protein
MQPVCKFVAKQIHRVGAKFIRFLLVNEFKADVLYKSFVDSPNNSWQLEYAVKNLKLYVELVNVNLFLMLSYVTVIRLLGNNVPKYTAN